MDDANDFNGDYSIIDSLSKDGFEGNLTDEGRGKRVGEKQAPVGGNLNGNFGVFDDDSSAYGYGYKGNVIITLPTTNQKAPEELSRNEILSLHTKLGFSASRHKLTD